MVWAHSACPSLKLRGLQLTKIGKKENDKHTSLLFRGYKHWQLVGEVISFWWSLFVLSSFSRLESLNLRERQPRPGTGFGLSPLFLGMVWTHSALFSFKIWEQTETAMLPVANIFQNYLRLVHGIYLSLAILFKWRQRPHRAAKTLDEEECVQTSTAEGQLRLSQIKTLYSRPVCEKKRALFKKADRSTNTQRERENEL